ncbi:GntR family transcriptional regulator [Glycomyces sp. L485]|uniref:GntR family transcriptional regulator n=1 Tax=Glycomyces sp. L485 TaxID=2909235 RepID=UPI001F4B1382|nr:GntR family transcriptional regulator [Glycomyces sp. L485]MCH7230191.1 GntR family transcriptional regulator [Glycomyces sp. L485]
MTNKRELITGASLHEQIARIIRTDIEAGKLRHEQKLPSDREQAERFGVSSPVVAKAMKMLTEEGRVVTKPRAGRIVNAPDQLENSEVKTPVPHLVLIGGYAGSGKSELGRTLSRLTGWAMVDKDTTTRPVVEKALEVMGSSPNDRESDLYLSEVRPREYEAMVATITENITSGGNVIATAPFVKELRDDAWIQRLQSLCDSSGAGLTVVWVYCDPESMHTYLRARGAARDTTKLDNWQDYLSKIDLDYRPSIEHAVIDNSVNSVPLLGQAKALVSKILG